MNNFIKFLAYFIVLFHVSNPLNGVSADCENYWLSQYEDVLPSINSRPNFPVALERAFQVQIVV